MVLKEILKYEITKPRFMPLIDGTTPVGSLFFRFFCLCVTASRFDCALLKFDYLWRNIFLHVVAIYIGHISATIKPYIKSLFRYYSSCLINIALLLPWRATLQGSDLVVLFCLKLVAFL